MVSLPLSSERKGCALCVNSNFGKENIQLSNDMNSILTQNKIVFTFYDYTSHF